MKTLFLSFWGKIINIGITAQLPSSEIRKIRLLNGVAAVILIMFFSYIPLLFYLYFRFEPRNPFPLVINAVVETLLFAVLYLNHKHHYHTAKIFMIILMNLVLFAFSVLSAGNSMMEYGLIVMVALPVIFFEKWRVTKHFAFLSFFLFWLAQVLNFYFPPQPEHDFFKNMIPFNLSCTFISLFFIIWNFKQEFIRYEETINQKNKAISEQNEELNTQSQAINQKNTELAKKNKDITASINYSRRIQSALLPADQELETALGKEQFFVLYQPKDIVSGDFYWIFSTVTKQPISLITDHLSLTTILAVADCTGHGVPGALMSMIGVNLLNEIVRSTPQISPDQILNRLHLAVRNSLKQHESQTHDGMDIALVKLSGQNKTWQKLEFAGAKNSLYWIKNGLLEEIKGDKMPIGGHQREEERIFRLHTFDLSAPMPSILYLFTDGYEDQFGGENIEKFRSKRLKNLLESIAHLPLPDQQKILAETIETWQKEGKQTQIDDRLGIGIRIG